MKLTLLLISSLFILLSCNKEIETKTEKKPRNKITFGIKKK